jgi:hypothetical protein
MITGIDSAADSEVHIYAGGAWVSDESLATLWEKVKE